MNDPNPQHVLERPYYGDYRFYHPDGSLMFITTERRANFYTTKDLVSQDTTDPKKFVFKTEPANWGFWDTSLHHYHLRLKKNRCVVCGSNEQLTKHHVLPVTFQRYYPNDPEDAGVRSHDMLLLCLDCHETYEQKYADPVRNQWAIKHEAHLNHRFKNTELGQAVKMAKTLLRKRLPAQIQRKLIEEVAKVLTKKPSKDDLNRLATLGWRDTQELLEKADMGKKVTDAWDLGELRRFWRSHFVESMNPQFLPEGWSIDAPVEHQFTKDSALRKN